MPMPRKSRSPPKEMLTFPVRAPKDLVEAFDKAIELGFINARSRNQAIIKLIQNFLNDVSLVINAFEEAQELAQSHEFKNSNLPPELLQLQLLLELVDPSKNASLENFTARYQTFVTTVVANSRNPELRELKAKLNSLLKEGDENE